MALLIFSIIVFLIISTAFLFNSPRFNKYFCENWEKLLLNSVFLIITSSVTILGVYWSIKTESENLIWSIKKDSDSKLCEQMLSFHNSCFAVILECSDTLTVAKRIKENVDKTHFTTRRFNVDIAAATLENSLTYQFAGSEYPFVLGAYIQRVRQSNVLLEHLYKELLKNNKISDYSLKIIE